MDFMKFLLVLLVVQVSKSQNSFATSDFPALHAIVNFFGGNGKNQSSLVKSFPLDHPGHNKGRCSYDFYLSGRNKQQCEKDEAYVVHVTGQRKTEVIHKPPIMVKCLEPVMAPNTTFVENTLRIAKSLEEIFEILKPIGNATKRHEPGNCVLLLFYTPSSLGCAHVAPHINLLPKMFPTLRVGAVDAYKFHAFNAEFGIVGLPTVLLFHQARPVVKFYSDIGSFSTFVTRHTGIKPIQPVPRASDLNGPLPTQPVEETDYVLVLAWSFIIASALYYFLKSRFCKKIWEVIKGIWRESEEQLEEQ